jgi:hypothetical protein
VRYESLEAPIPGIAFLVVCGWRRTQALTDAIAGNEDRSVCVARQADGKSASIGVELRYVGASRLGMPYDRDRHSGALDHVEGFDGYVWVANGCELAPNCHSLVMVGRHHRHVVGAKSPLAVLYVAEAGTTAK